MSNFRVVRSFFASFHHFLRFERTQNEERPSDAGLPWRGEAGPAERLWPRRALRQIELGDLPRQPPGQSGYEILYTLLGLKHRLDKL